MAQSIDQARVIQFKSNVILLYQRRGAKLRGTTRVEDVVGKQHHFERLGATAAVKKVTRHSDTPLVESDHSRRMVSMFDFEWADLVDKEDKIRMLITPESEYAINAALALGRSYDNEIILAFNGTAKAGEDGSTSVAFPAGQKIADGGAGLTVAKLRTASRLLNEADVPEDGRFIVISPIGLEDLLADTNVTSTDFNSVRALVNGDLNTFLGFTFIKHTGLPKSGNIRSCFAWHREAMGVAQGADISVRMDPRVDKSYSLQVYASATFSATRIQDNGVVQLDIDESV